MSTDEPARAADPGEPAPDLPGPDRAEPDLPDPDLSDPAQVVDGDESQDSASVLPRRRGRHSGRGTRRQPRGGVIGFLRETAIVLVTALVLSLLIKTFLAQAFYIPSESMQNTLMVNDRVLVSLLEPGPLELKRGDIVVFTDPGGWLSGTPRPQRSGGTKVMVDVLTFIGVLPQDSGDHLIKRVIGLPGDHVVCCDAQQRITVNGVALDEAAYLPPQTEPSAIQFDITVPADSVWVMGDNRGFSQDSRFHQDLPGGGSVTEQNIVGRAVLLFWPFDRFTTLSNHPEVFDVVPAP